MLHRGGKIDDGTAVADTTGRLSVDDEGGPCVDPTQCTELVEIDLGQRRCGDPATDDVDDGIDAAEGRDRLGEESFHVQLVGDVGADGDGGAVVAEDRVDGR